jgi:hypothetical protein
MKANTKICGIVFVATTQFAIKNNVGIQSMCLLLWFHIKIHVPFGLTLKKLNPIGKT